MNDQFRQWYSREYPHSYYGKKVALIGRDKEKALRDREHYVTVWSGWKAGFMAGQKSWREAMIQEV